MATELPPARRRWLGLERGMLLVAVLWAALLPIGAYRLYATDEVQYFSYLRSVYFDGDLDFANEYAYFAAAGERRGDLAVYNALLRPNDYDPPLNPRTGKYRNVAPVGSAILWSPFFLAADGLVRAANLFGAGIAADGFSKPYIAAVCLASACYVLLGLLLSYRIARRWASQRAATLATLAIWLASPLIWYTYVQMPWSHGPSFAVVAVFLTLWLGPAELPVAQWAGRRSVGRWLALGLAGGLLAISREQLGLFLLLPAIEGLAAYWQLGRGRDWPALRGLALRHGLFLLVFVAALSPQLAAYAVLNGEPRPSGTVSGKLDPASPHFFATLLSPEHGAFFWHPLLAVSLGGLALLWRRHGLIGALLALGFVAQVYINGAISTWHLSGSFGFRRLIECTPIFIAGLALLADLPRLPRKLALALAALAIAWNGGLALQSAVTRPAIRSDGLIWSGMLQAQLEAPARAWRKADALLFNRCELIKNC